MATQVTPFADLAFPALLRVVNDLGRFPALLRTLFVALERRARRRARRHPDPRHPAAVEEDLLALRLAFLALAHRVVGERCLSEPALRGFFHNLVRGLLVRRGDPDAKARFRSRQGCSPPDLLVLSPGKTCNLRCVGCYAAAGPAPERLPWATLDRIVHDARDLFGTRFFVLSGGEPLLYGDDGKGVLDLAERHPDCFFVMYTNGTLVTDEVARRLGDLGNLSPALSVEGLRERTDARRGAGIFDRVLRAMEKLRRERVLFGLSLTATRENADEVLSDELLDALFGERGALYAFVFHYMPIGRSASLDLMLTPAQRLALWRRVWQVVRERRLVILDFWNSGTASHGCIAAGRPGGYFHVNWNGACSPCVFVPFSSLNVNDVFARGGTLEDVWASPFFADIRAWQRRYGYRESGERYDGGGNWLTPCLIRDHHADFRRILERHHPEPTDDDARASVGDVAYRAGLEEFGGALATLADPLWQACYCGRRGEWANRTSRASEVATPVASEAEARGGPGAVGAVRVAQLVATGGGTQVPLR